MQDVTKSDLVLRRLRDAFGTRIIQKMPLASMTTFKIGGAADLFFETSNPEEVIQIIDMLGDINWPVTVLGGGSNVVVSSRGVRGLVIRIRRGKIVVARPGVVRVDAGVSINELVRWTVARGLGGISKWAGTPGTVGGALHGNAHFQGDLIGDKVASVGIVTRQGKVFDASARQMCFGYDTSRLKVNQEWALWAELSLYEEEPQKLRDIAKQSLAYRKRTQPLSARSAGCVFQNPDVESGSLLHGVVASAGALIEKAGLKNHSVGGARVSTLHGNFIVANEAVTSEDIRTLIETCRTSVHERFGITLRDEIVYLGEF